MFMVSEAETGYICGFDVYTGKDSKPDDAGCARITSTVMDLLDSIKLLEKAIICILIIIITALN